MESYQEAKRKYYLSEFELYDGDRYITFNIVDICAVRDEITVAITNGGKISVCEFDLKSYGRRLYFEYGIMQEQIAVDDFTQFKESINYDN